MNKNRDYEFNTPILFLIFNRPEYQQKVFDQIKKMRPKQLFIAADGPQYDVPSDQVNCKKAQAIIDQINWDCEVKTLFRDKNLGCAKGVSSAISWFFEHVEEGIILEDDCVPNESFFYFCEKMLEYYRDDKRVMMICGTNYIAEKIDSTESYFFSRFYSSWGWATWKRAWKCYDHDMSYWKSIDQEKELQQLFSKKDVRNFWKSNFNNVEKLDSWAFRWCCACLLSYGLSITSKYNLISNIGHYGLHGNGTGSVNNDLAFQEMNLEKIIHPRNVFPRSKEEYSLYVRIGIIKEFSNREKMLLFVKKPVNFIKKHLSNI
jgi:hypothetical protein